VTFQMRRRAAMVTVASLGTIALALLVSHVIVSAKDHQPYVLARDVTLRGRNDVAVRDSASMTIPRWQVQSVTGEGAFHITPLPLALTLTLAILLGISVYQWYVTSELDRANQEVRSKHTLAATTDGIWEWDTSTGAMLRSPQLWKQLGYRDDESVSTIAAWTALLHPDDREQYQAALANHLAGLTESYEATYRVKHASQRWHTVTERGRVVVRGPEGAPRHMLGLLTDMTERRSDEERVRQEETLATMGRLAAHIAHEINNPLAGIQMSLVLVKDAIPRDHPHAKYVDSIEREIARISSVTRDLVETYRPGADVTHTAPVRTVILDAVSSFADPIQRTGVRVTVEVGSSDAIVPMASSVLRQCVCALVQNAIEASPPDSRVIISGESRASEFVVSVIDSGPGVPKAMRERIFERFVSTKVPHLIAGAMGLSLTLARRAVDAAGGSLHVDDAPAGGARFTMRLPLVGGSSKPPIGARG
jgi:PAS domain S-box-containing protein